MTNARLWLAVGVASLALAGCPHAFFYTGDGQFSDNVLALTAARYTIDLGAIDLSHPGKYSYRLSGLPRANFNVGIDVSEAGENRSKDPRPDHSATVRMLLKTSKDEIVISEQGSLNTWVRGYGEGGTISELYLMGQLREVPSKDGGMTYERLNAKASGGHGTYFDAQSDTTYLLELEILASTMIQPARLVVRGYRQFDP